MCDCELPKEDFFSVTSQDGIRVAGAAGVRSHLNRTQVALLLSSSTIMLLSALSPLLVLPLVSAGVHKFKLQKLPPADSNPSLESAYLAEKYGGRSQVPLMGSGIGRNVRLSRPSVQDGEELFWTQDEFPDCSELLCRWSIVGTKDTVERG